jgi:hypothetical protein
MIVMVYMVCFEHLWSHMAHCKISLMYNKTSNEIRLESPSHMFMYLSGQVWTWTEGISNSMDD